MILSDKSSKVVLFHMKLTSFTDGNAGKISFSTLIKMIGGIVIRLVDEVPHDSFSLLTLKYSNEAKVNKSANQIG